MTPRLDPPFPPPKSPPPKSPQRAPSPQSPLSPQSPQYYNSPPRNDQQTRWTEPFLQQRRFRKLRPRKGGRKFIQDQPTQATAAEICLTFARKFLLEVLGGAGAAWGSSEVLELRTDATDWFWRPVAILVGLIMFLRWLCELTTAWQAWYIARQMENGDDLDTFLWSSSDYDEESLALMRSPSEALTEASTLYSSTGLSFSESTDAGYEAL